MKNCCFLLVYFINQRHKLDVGKQNYSETHKFKPTPNQLKTMEMSNFLTEVIRGLRGSCLELD